MTTVVLWKSIDQFSADIGEGDIIVTSDSRASVPCGTLTDNCTKIFELPVRCQVTNDYMDSDKREEFNSSIVVAIAGSTTVAHNVVFSLQQGLSRLVGMSVPSTDDIAQFTSKVATSLTREVGTLLGKGALTEIIIVGNLAGPVDIFSIKPGGNVPIVYRSDVIRDFPYAIGSGAKKFTQLYQDAIRAWPQEASITQAPMRVFDEHFVKGGADPKSGGDLQILSISRKTVTRFMPMRWNDKMGNYTKLFYGQDLIDCAIGPARIATSNWLLDNC